MSNGPNCNKGNVTKIIQRGNMTTLRVWRAKVQARKRGRKCC